MTPPTTRPAVLLLAGLALALAGCGKPPEATKSDDAGKGGPAGAAANTPPTPAGPVAPTDPSLRAAETFVKDLVAGKGDPNKLSTPFLKAVGLPLLSAEDKGKGYNLSAAQAWLNRAGAGLPMIAPPAGFSGGKAAVFVGPAGAGRYLVRVVQADGAWKVDGFAIGTAKANDPPKPATADEAFQDYAVLALLDALTGTALGLDDRAPLAAAVMSPKLRSAWAPPFGDDKDHGLDYNQGKLGQIMNGFGEKATAVARTRTGPDSFKAEITKGGATRAFAVKLARTPAGDWVVDEFKPE